MNREPETAIDLTAAARKLMTEHGLLADFPHAVTHEVEILRATPPSPGSARDLRSLLWSSIDNAESRDLDQVEYVEMLGDDVVRLLLGIADVDSHVPGGSAIDTHAAVNTVSVYAGVVIFPMLPETLSTDLTSLNQDADRVAVVTELHVNASGVIVHSDVFRALVRNHAKLDYVTIGAWLEGEAPPHEIASNAELEAQVTLQADVSRRLERVRREAGALDIDTIEARPVLQDGKIIDITLVRTNPARDLVENFMVSANVVMARFLAAHDMPAIRRVVRTPQRWDRIVDIARERGVALPAEPQSVALSGFLQRMKASDPEGYPDLSMTVVKLMGAGEYVMDDASSSDDNGHFGLAVAQYTHSTAPNRRYPDLIIQRIAKAALEGLPSPYTAAELDAIAKLCTAQEDAARKVERTMRKMAAAALMQPRIGEVFDAIVTGSSGKGTYVRLVQPPVEGRILDDSAKPEVGTTVRVRLAGVNAVRGHIDFTTA